LNLKSRFVDIVGSDNVSDDPILLETYAKDHSFIPKRSPLLVVFPRSRQQVQEIVKLANDVKIPIVPVSSGPPRFRGDTVPALSGIIIDFSRMKKIMRIDPVNRYVRVEPGVTYGDLIPELRKLGLRLNIPLLPRFSKSVVTSYLEREPVVIPKYQYDYIDPLLTAEVVFGTGDIFRTGSASGPGPFEMLKADGVNPWGPGSIDFIRFLSGAQGTMGLVTWATIKVEVIPTLQKLYFIPSENLSKLVGLADKLLRMRVPDECLIVNNIFFAKILAQSQEEYERLKADLPAWFSLICLAGFRRYPEERISIMEKYLKDVSDELKLHMLTTLTGAEGKEKEILELLSSAWVKDPYWKIKFGRSCQDIFFLTSLSRAPMFTKIMAEIDTKFGHCVGDIGCYIQPLVQGRGCHCEFHISYDESRPQEVEKVKTFFMYASETLMRNGAFFSRPYGLWAEMVYGQYAEGVNALRKLKMIFDPNNILNPGKLCF